MEFSLRDILGLVLCTECFAGITVNLIIVAANIKKWKILKSLPTCDKLLSCLVISRSLFIFMIFVFIFLYQFYPRISLNFVVIAIIKTNTTILHCTNLWFATVLCVFYCVKITSYNWKFFTIMKTKISTLVPWLLMGSLITSVSSSLPFSLYFYDLKPQNLSSGLNESIIIYKADFVQNFNNQFLIFLTYSCPPVIIFLVADSLLLHSLWMHTRRMRSSGSGFRSPNLETHFSVVKSMSLFLGLQVIYFVLMNVLYSGSLHDNVLTLVTLIITCSVPFLHSLYMIFFCSEIKKAFISLCCCLTRCE